MKLGDAVEYEDLNEQATTRMYHYFVYSLANRCLYLINIQIKLSHQRKRH